MPAPVRHSSPDRAVASVNPATNDARRCRWRRVRRTAMCFSLRPISTRLRRACAHRAGRWRRRARGITASPRMRPWVASRLCARHSVFTSRSDTILTMFASAPAVRRARSRQRFPFGLPAAERAFVLLHHARENRPTRFGARVAAVSTTAQPTRLRLCGMVDEPPLPAAAGSATSPTSVCIISETSHAIFPKAPVSMPRNAAASAMRSRCVCHGNSGRLSFRSSASDCATGNASSRRLASVPAAPPNCSTSTRAFSSARR